MNEDRWHSGPIPTLEGDRISVFADAEEFSWLQRLKWATSMSSPPRFGINRSTGAFLPGVLGFFPGVTGGT